MKRVLPLLLLVTSCGPTVRTYEVEVSKEQICRTFDPAPESCQTTTSPTLVLNVRIEDRQDGRALIYGRTDSSAERVYQATVPREGRYEVEEVQTSSNAQSGCQSTTYTIVALNVDDRGLEGGEEFRVEENKKCNDLNQRRVTRRLREWLGSRTDSDTSPLP
ncbi:MAG: hypothetical protein AB2A00_16200 [Myxococcota bacterium]